MKISLNTYMTSPISMGEAAKSKKGTGATASSSQKRLTRAQRQPISEVLKPLESSKDAVLSPLRLTKGINPNNGNIFDVFNQVDDLTRKIDFTKGQDAWLTCLAEEVEEFAIARNEYYQDKTIANREHMEEEMGDIFYTAASIANEADIDAEDAFRASTRKNLNRLNLMERFCLTNSNMPDNLKDCTDDQRRALWNAAKQRMYGAQAKRFVAEA